MQSGRTRKYKRRSRKQAAKYPLTGSSSMYGTIPPYSPLTAETIRKAVAAMKKANYSIPF